MPDPYFLKNAVRRIAEGIPWVGKWVKKSTMNVERVGRHQTFCKSCKKPYSFDFFVNELGYWADIRCPHCSMKNAFDVMENVDMGKLEVLGSMWKREV